MIRKLLIGLLGFLAVTALLGGFALLGGSLQPPAEMLHGAFGGSYVIPALALLLLVGVPASFTIALLIKHDAHCKHWARVSAAAIVIFEITEIAVIGFPPGAARVMQVFYLGLGALIFLLSFKLHLPPIPAPSE